MADVTEVALSAVGSSAQLRNRIGRDECLLWVKSRHRGISNRCPLYPHKRTLIERIWMSAHSNQLSPDMRAASALIEQESQLKILRPIG
jgi:hypothetical protein